MRNTINIRIEWYLLLELIRAIHVAERQRQVERDGALQNPKSRSGVEETKKL
jgi:hypothetical protein